MANKINYARELQFGSRLQLTLRKLSTVSGAAKSKLPISIDMLRMVGHLLGGEDPVIPTSRLLWGLIVIGFFFLMRRSEYALDENGGGKKCHAIQVRDIVVVDSNGVATTEFENADRVYIYLDQLKTINWEKVTGGCYANQGMKIFVLFGLVARF